jgi:MFS family permease
MFQGIRNVLLFQGSRNVLLLASSQAMMMSAIVMSMALAAILGSALAPDKSLATLPIAVMVIGVAIASLPAAMLMRRFGRRTGFLIGAALGVSGSMIAALGLQRHSFELFVLGHLLLGCYQGFANYYRFAAAEAVDLAHVSKAIAGWSRAVSLLPSSGRNWASGGETGSPADCSSDHTSPKPHSA